MLRDYSVLGNLPQLTELNLFSHGFSELPEEIKKLTNLKILILDYCENLKDYSSLAYLTNLEELSLRYCKLSEIPKEVASLKKMKKFVLASNRENIHREDITAVSDISLLLNLNNLEVLILHDCDIRILPEELKFLDKIREIELVNCPFLYDIDVLFELTQIERITVSGIRITMAEFEKLVATFPNAQVTKF
jgi:Leucine-rich repeat (LRR) protein